MTTHPLGSLLDEYRAGLDAEIALLGQLTALAREQRESAGAPDALEEIGDARDRVMTSLMALEAQLAPMRQQLAASRDSLRALPEFSAVSALHQRASALVAEIAATDTESLAALHEAELARRFAAESLEKGESTLAAYRRVVAPGPAQATLVNRRG